MAENGVTEKSTPAYIPLATLINFIGKLKETALPPVIDSSLTQNLSGGMSGALMTALRFLALIDKSGKVQPALKELVAQHGTDQWKAVLGKVVSAAYSDIIDGLDITVATPKQLDDQFRENGGIEGQMIEKSVRFYLAALVEAGATISPHFRVRKARPNGKKTSVRRSSSARRTGARNTLEEEPEEESYDPATTTRFQIPIPGKTSATIIIPNDLGPDDWEMLTTMFAAYVKRLQAQQKA